MGSSNAKESNAPEVHHRVCTSSLLADMQADENGGEGYMTDITLRVSGTDFELRTHKVILGKGIPFFRQVFESGMREVKDGEVSFEKDEIDPESLNDLVRSLYGREVVIHAKNVFQLHSAANFLQMDDVAAKCVDFLVKNLTPESAAASWLYAQDVFQGSEALQEVCKDFILSRFVQVYPTDGFLGLSLEAVAGFLSSDELAVTSENDVVDAVLMWLMSDWPQRHEHTVRLLELIRWAGVTSDVHSCQSAITMGGWDELLDLSELQAFVTITKQLFGLPKSASAMTRRVTAHDLAGKK